LGVTVNHIIIITRFLITMKQMINLLTGGAEQL